MKVFAFSPLQDHVEPNQDFEKVLTRIRTEYKQLNNNLFESITKIGKDKSAVSELVSRFGKEEDYETIDNVFSKFVELFRSFLTQSSKTLNIRNITFSVKNLCEEVILLLPINGVLDKKKSCVAILFLAGEMIRVLSDIYYYSLETNKDAPHIHYANVGAEYLDLTWRGYGTRMLHVVRNTIELSIMDITVLLLRIVLPHNIKKTDKKDLKDVERSSLAFADYAYSKNGDYNNGKNIEFSRSKNCPILQYGNDAKFSYGYGVHGALGEFVLEGELESKIFVAFSGTDFHSELTAAQNVFTDLVQVFAIADCAYLAAVGIVKEIQDTYPDKKIIVAGHSLGGGEAQFSVASLNGHHNNTHAVCYSSAGLSEASVCLTKKKSKSRGNNNIVHIVLKRDPVPKIGYQLGKVKVIQSRHRFLKAHLLKNVNETINEQPVVACLVLK